MKISFFSSFLLVCSCLAISVWQVSAQSGGVPAAVAPVTVQSAPQNNSGIAQENAAAPYQALQLNEEQQKQFRQIDADYADKKRALRNSGAGDSAALQALKDERTAARKAVLTPVQIKKYDEIIAYNKAQKAAQLQKQQEVEAAKVRTSPKQAKQ
jgi:hypothetical protein